VPHRTLALMWLAWWGLLTGFQAVAAARIQPQRPDHVLAWTATETGRRSNDDQPYLLEPFLNRQVAWDSEFYLSIALNGYDDPAVRAIGPADAPLTLRPGQRALVPCGFAMALPEGFEGQVRPRSGLAAKFGVTVLNAPGTIDADYRGEVKVILINHGDSDFVIARGDRIAQLVIAPVTAAQLVVTATLDDTPRGAGGFGSTGHQ